MTTHCTLCNTTDGHQETCREHASNSILSKQVADWRKERARLDDLIAHATGATPAMPEAAMNGTHAFKNFHRLLCERFGYCHDEQYWWRDQLSLIEHIAAQSSPAPDDEWLTTAHMICTDAGVPQGHIQQRLEALRELVPSPAPAVAGEAMQGQEIDAAIYNFTGISKSQFPDEYSELRNLADYLLAAPQGEKQ